MTIDIMIDLETWGTTPGSDIRSIGATIFDPVEGRVWMGDPWMPFYVATENPIIEETSYTSCDSCGGEWYAEIVRKYPLTRDPKTVEWWAQQSPEAQAAFANLMDLREALVQFAQWVSNLTPATPPGYATSVRLWANGPDFDVSILAAAYRAVGLPVPWHYRAPRDFRTVTDLAGMTHADFASHGVEHHALHDATAQAITVCRAYERLGLSKRKGLD